MSEQKWHPTEMTTSIPPSSGDAYRIGRLLGQITDLRSKLAAAEAELKALREFHAKCNEAYEGHWPSAEFEKMFYEALRQYRQTIEKKKTK